MEAPHDPQPATATTAASPAAPIVDSTSAMDAATAVASSASSSASSAASSSAAAAPAPSAAAPPADAMDLTAATAPADALEPATTSPSPSIAALPAASRSLISSDQLLTAPSSIVRELLDNALDAGATNVQVQLIADTHGAIGSIEVRDNGCGIAANERAAIAQPHSTSKLRAFEQISASGDGALRSRGFRGEALHYLTQCSKLMEVQSKVLSAPLGWKVSWNEGRRSDLAGANAVAMVGSGTIVRASGLFFNRPVRQAFQRRDANIKAESQTIQEMLRSYAFAHPHVRFICNAPQFSKQALVAPPSANGTASWSSAGGLALFRASLPLVVGTASGLSQMLEFSIEDAGAGVQLEGCVTKCSTDASNKELVRSKADRVFLYVDLNRPVTLPWLSKAIVAEWRALGATQLQRRRMRALGQDPTTASVVPDTAATSALSAKFPLLLLKIQSLPSSSSSSSSAALALDLNRSPDKRDVVLGDEGFVKRLLTDLAKRALQDAMAKLDQQEQKEWEEKRNKQQPPPPQLPPMQQQPAMLNGVSEEKHAQSDGPSVNHLASTFTSEAKSNADGMRSSPTVAPSISTLPAAAASDRSPLRAKLEPKDEEEDEVQITSSQIVSTPPRFKSSQQHPTSPAPGSASASGFVPAAAPAPPRMAHSTGSLVDFSTFTRTLTQPQSFSSSKQPLSQQPSPPRYHSQQSTLPLVPMQPMAMAAAAASAMAASSSVASPAAANGSRSHSSPKRARVSGGGATTSSPLRQTQLSMIDPANAEISLAQRGIHLDNDTLDELEAKFMQLRGDEKENIPQLPQPLGKIEGIAKDLWVVRVPPAASSAATAATSAAIPSLPSLHLFSPAHASEALLFQNLCTSFLIPSCPLDEPIAVNEHFPSLSAEERGALLAHVMKSEEQTRAAAIPPGCITFSKAMQLCGFTLQLEQPPNEASAAPALNLVSVPSDASITIDDFLATLRHIWADPCFQQCGLLRVRRIPAAATAAAPPLSDAAAAVAAQVQPFAPNASTWRVDGIRACIAQQAASVTRKQPQTASSATKQPPSSSSSPSDSSTAAQVAKLLDRLQRQVDDGLAASATAWSAVVCPHGRPVSVPCSWATRLDF